MATVENFVVKVNTEGVDKLDRLSSVAANASAKMNLLAASILGVSFGAFIQGAIEMADRMTDLSDATNLTVASIVNFSNALEQAGGKSKNSEKAILTFFNTMDSALQGSDKARKSFEKLGISLDDLKTKSEQELLNKAIQGLSQMESGATRTALAQDVFGKSMRSVDFEKFAAGLKNGQISAEEAAKGILAGGEAADKMAQKFNTLQQGALNAIEPILNMFGGLGITVNSATIGFQILGTVMLAAFGASLLSSIKTINTALGITAGLTNLIGKSPLGLIAKLGAAGAVAATTANEIEKLITANEKLTASENQSAAETARLKAQASAAGKGKPFVRPSELSPEDKMLLESAKKTADSEANIRRDRALMSANELMAIRINADAEIAKVNLDFDLKEKETKLSFAKERAAKILEINTKAALDEAKFKRALDVKIATEMMAQAEQDAKDMAAYYQEVDRARMQAFEQTDAIRKANDELKARIGLQSKIVEMGTMEADRTQKIFDIQQEQKRQLEAIAKIPNLPYNERLQKEEEIDQKFRERIDLVNQEADARKAREQDFSAGFRETMRKYEESITPLKQGAAMAEAVYSNMGSALDNFVETGKFKFNDFARSVIMDLLKIQLRAAATSLFNSVLGTFGFGLPGRAVGGPVMPNQAYIVGERGPEVFLPKSSGNIIPNSKLTGGNSALGGGANVTYNINAVDAMSFKQMLARDPSFLYSVTEQGRKTIPSTRR